MKWIGLCLLAVVLVVVVVGLLLPQDFEIVRTTRIAAHPARVLQLVWTLDRWEEWWPWERANAGKRLVVAAGGVGAPETVLWRGRPAAGRLALTKTTIACIEYDLSFDANARPDRGAFLFRTSSGFTEVTWRVNGHFEKPVLGGYLARLADAMHGGMLAWGLHNIKELAEQDTSELNLYYQNDDGNEVVEKID